MINQDKMKNRLRELLQSRGIEKLKPTDEKLAEMGMNSVRWKRIWYNGHELKVREAIAIAEFIKCEVTELTVN
jgi:hypothetical protein